MKKPFNSRLLYKKYLSEDHVIVGFEAEMDFEAGQFFHIIVDAKNQDDPIKGFRPYSILNSPDDAKRRRVIETYMKLIPNGLASEYVKSLKENDPVLLRGPFGKFMLEKRDTEHIFLCAGTGITPVNSIIAQH